ncbi:Bikaverin cluster transcription factor bik5 [Paramyrothecium foliicola]|nr:Bikaverin cluster transcription factor bik5 [Paramyrothecium foliicola]
MSSDILNFNKPCSACRRRKVRCDKAQPCNNCVRHGVNCVYEASRDTTVSQQVLQDRVERLERIIEDMAAASTSSNSTSRFSQRNSYCAPSPFGGSGSDETADTPLDTGSQVFEKGSSYYMGPDHWMNMEHMFYEPRYMLNVVDDDWNSSAANWPLSPSPSKLKDVSHLHLEIDKEDVLIKLFLAHVEPFIRIIHHGYMWQLVSDFRQGSSTCGREVEALIFAAQYIAASVLPANLIQDKVGVPAADLRPHLQRATEAALERANVMRSRNTILFCALLFYITCKFHTGDCEVASTLLGLAGKVARRMGMHREPAYYGYSAWIVEVRRRMWGHLASLDIQSYSLDGSESVLMNTGDVQRSLNADDPEWTPSCFVGRDPGPQDQEGFTDNACALIRREFSRAYHRLVECRRTATSCEDLVPIINESEKYTRLKFTHHFDGSNPMHEVVTRWHKAMARSLHVCILYFHASPARGRLCCHEFEQLREQLYSDCLDCLEELERGEAAATLHHWQWSYRWPMPLHVIVGLLSGLAQHPDHKDTDRAWKQVEVVFQRYNNDEITMAKLPAWHVIETLCDQAMLQHQGRVHDGRAYTKRLHQSAEATGDGEHTPELVTDNIDLLVPGLSNPYFDQMFDSTAAPTLSLSDFYTADAGAMDFLTMHGDDEYFSMNI